MNNPRRGPVQPGSKRHQVPEKEARRTKALADLECFGAPFNTRGRYSDKAARTAVNTLLAPHERTEVSLTSCVVINTEGTFVSDCWTCALRNSKCDRGEPICLECSRVGVECEYGLPIWWHDEALQEAQKKINKRLIKDQNTRMRLEKQQTVKSSRQGAKTIQDSFTPVRQPFKPTNPVSVLLGDHSSIF